MTDIDRAKAFYADQVGFHVDHDVQQNDGLRILQLTPRGFVPKVPSPLAGEG